MDAMSGSYINGGAPFTSGRTNELGASPAQFRDLVRTRQVRQLFKGVYVDTRVADTRSLRAKALMLVKPADAVFCGPTVAYLLGIDVFPPKDRFNFAPQCVVPHHHARCRRPFVDCREGYLPASDLMDIDGLCVTTPLRATVDMLRTMWRPHALAAADGMAHAGLVTRVEAMDSCTQLKGYPGIVQARALAAMIEPLAESPGESWQRLRVIDAGLPTPESQLVIVDRLGREIARLDNGYAEARIGFEYDGREWHEDDVAQVHDEERRTYLRDVLGWRLSVAKKASIFGSDPSFEQQIGQWLGIVAQPRRW
jgi:hypothetical protein